MRKNLISESVFMNNSVSSEMIAKVIYSINKRAKRMRNLKHLCVNTEDAKRYESMEKSFYAEKQTLLNHFSADCIHKLRKTVQRRAYDWEANYYEYVRNGGEVSAFYDKHHILHHRCTIEDMYYEYFLLYDIGGYLTHLPIPEDSVDAYHLPVITIREILNENEQKAEYTVSDAFCDRILKGLNDGTLHIEDEMQMAA